MLPCVIDHSVSTRSPLPMILVDAAGTLIEVRGSVGEAYSKVAHDFCIEVPAKLIDAVFAPTLREQPPMTVPLNLPLGGRKDAEFLWWKTLARQVFERAARRAGQKAAPASTFDTIFEALFEYFKCATAWRVFPDVVAALQALRGRGVRLAVVSNFDSRLEDILAALELGQYFEAIHFSTGLGFAKPDPRIFEAVLSSHNLSPGAVWHVGDGLRDDVGGALGAGIRPIWLDRSMSGTNNGRVTRIQRLDELPDLLLKE